MHTHVYGTLSIHTHIYRIYEDMWYVVIRCLGPSFTVLALGPG